MSQMSIASRLGRSVFSMSVALVSLSLAMPSLHAAPIYDPENPPTVPNNPPTPTDPNLKQGPFLGDTKIQLTDGRSVRIDRQFNIQSQLQSFWNSSTPTFQSRITSYLGVRANTGYSLYSITTQIAQADANSRLYARVHQTQKWVQLDYTVPGHMMRFKVSLNNLPNPTVTVRFDLKVSLRMSTTGPANAPLVLDSAVVQMTNTRVNVDAGNVVYDAFASVYQFFSGTNFNQKIARALYGQQTDIKSQVQPSISLLNSLMSGYGAQRYGNLTPLFNPTTKVLTLNFTRSSTVNLQGANVDTTISKSR